MGRARSRGYLSSHAGRVARKRRAGVPRGKGPGLEGVIAPSLLSGAAHRPFLAVVENPVLIVGCERVVSGTAVEIVPHPDATGVEVPADEVVVAVAPVEAVRAKAAEDGVPVAVAVEGV